MAPDTRTRAAILLAGPLLMLIGASRMAHLNTLTMNQDEIWSVWQTFGSPAEIIQWTPYDWPPLYYLALGAWRGLAGLHPVVLRYFSALVFLLGCAFLYRAALRITPDRRAARLSCLAYAALGYATLISLEVRGYALLLGLMPPAIWLMLRYFDRPGIGRALALAGCMAAMFYTSPTSLGAFLAMGVYSLVVYRRAVWRWWLPGMAAALLALPEIISKYDVAIRRTAATAQLTPPPLPQALYEIFWNWTGYTFAIWLLLMAAAVIPLIYRRRAARAANLALLLWAFGAPVLMYILNPLLGFFSARYAWWVMIGIALLAGVGLAGLPRLARWGAAALLAWIAFVPLPVAEYSIFSHPSELGRNFAWLQRHMIPGDALVVDPGSRCGRPEEWDYYLRVYFPNGLTFVTDPQGYRRVWYVSFDGQQDEQLQAAVAAGRISQRFVGPPGCLFRLYEAPPDAGGLLFENGMRFHGADVLEDEHPWYGPLIRREGETVRLRLWWSADRPIERDYSVGLYLMRGSAPPADSADGAPQPIYPQGAPGETSRWTSGTYYIEERQLTLPFPTPRTSYHILLAVYFWQTSDQRIPAPGVSDDGLLPLRRVEVMSY